LLVELKTRFRHGPFFQKVLRLIKKIFIKICTLSLCGLTFFSSPTPHVFVFFFNAECLKNCLWVGMHKIITFACLISRHHKWDVMIYINTFHNFGVSLAVFSFDFLGFERKFVNKREVIG